MFLLNTNNCLIIRLCCDHFVGVHQKKERRGHTKTELSLSVSEDIRMLLAACAARKTACTNQMWITKWRSWAAGRATFHPCRMSWERRLLGTRGDSDLKRCCSSNTVFRCTAPFWMVPSRSFRNEVHVLVVIISHISAVYTSLFFHRGEPSKAEG